MATPDTARLARRIVRESVRLRSHLPELHPLRQLPAEDDSVEQMVAVDVDLAAFVSDDGTPRCGASPSPGGTPSGPSPTRETRQA